MRRTARRPFGSGSHVGEIDAGYHDQRLVDRIPAFQPSIVIEESRRSSKVDPDRVNAHLQVAERAAKAAAGLDLGTVAVAAAAKPGPAIIRRLNKPLLAPGARRRFAFGVDRM